MWRPAIKKKKKRKKEIVKNFTVVEVEKKTTAAHKVLGPNVVI